MSKNQSKNEATTLEQLKAMLAEAEAKTSQLKAENAKLRQGMSTRPSDALVISTCLAFQKGTHQELVGKRLRLSVPQEALGALHISGEVKRNKTGNAYVWCTGYIDTSKLDLSAAVEAGTEAATEKSTKSFAETVLGK